MAPKVTISSSVDTDPVSCICIANPYFFIGGVPVGELLWVTAKEYCFPLFPPLIFKERLAGDKFWEICVCVSPTQAKNTQ